MAVSTYGRRLSLESFFISEDTESWALSLEDAERGELVCDCEIVADAKRVDFGLEYVLKLGVTCEWVD